MDHKLTFKERSKIAKEILSKQLPVTLKEAQEQVKKLEQQSSPKSKKRKF